MSKASPFPFPAPGRVVRQLDRAPGEAAITEVAGFQIKKDIPPPIGRSLAKRLRAAMDALEVDEYVEVPIKSAKSTAYKVADDIAGKKFTAASYEAGIRIWRIE